MTRPRAQDQSITHVPPRTERFYSSEERWYFRTREGDQIGPFRYRSEAQSSLERFLDELKAKM